ncbi:hypothetical protein SY88_23615 [Clostridiales bacterium PH28_bin88]|nr:hypothetical protein SY88_23615 [Clostridiales bacterium PH28_bin88]MBC7193826.1 hypothetical protein [Marinobacter sp.]
MNKYKIIMLSLIVICIAGLGFLFAATGMADDDHGFKRHFEREDQHSIPFLESDNEGNETAGQMAAWLLLVANLPVALSLLIKGTNRFAPLRIELKKALANLNRTQKKALMWLHYYLNPAILGIALWHWLSSRCKSSALPELGLIVMVTVIALGFLIKFKLCPKTFRKYAYQIHTQPVIFVAMFLVLTVGHLIVD